MLSDLAALQARLAAVRDRIAAAANRAGRDPSSVRLVAVSKTFPTDDVRALANCGHIDFGENKLQEALPKIAATAGMGLVWHLVGHLQSNKARKAASVFDLVHSVDTGTMAERLDEAAAAAGRRLELLVQVNLAGEAAKHGAPLGGLLPVFDAARRCRSVNVAGLMAIPPATADPEEARPHFRMLRDLRDRLLSEGVDRAMLRELSMGMSADFEVAVEEGATIVRVGTAIFGRRPPLR
ncbi:MAG: YggS family pyridoxal phosphate-dependent enzyme [Acidobacteriota bacterium]